MLRIRCQCPRFQLLIAASLLIALTAFAAPGDGAQPFHPTRILIKPKPGNSLSSLHARQGNILLSSARDSGVQIIDLGQPGRVQEAIAAYERSGEVEYAEPDYILHAARMPNDPRYLDGALWGLHNTGLNGGRTGADIGAEEAWELSNSASNIVVAIIDSGFRYTHEDLQDNLWANSREVPGNGVDDDDNGVVDDIRGINAIEGSGDPWDDDGHGTHVAGIIGASGDNGKGVVGVAWHVQLMACKFMDNSGRGSTSDAIRAIDYARRQGADIINASWGGPAFSFSLEAAVRRARDAGVIFVAAAGNDGEDLELTPFYPASFSLDNVVAVAATTRGDLLAGYSNYGGHTVTVAAPGSDILSTFSNSDHSYQVESGTSMAAPCVAGALALVKACFPTESYLQVIERVIAANDPIPSLTGKSTTGGRLSLSKALRAPVKAATAARLSVLPAGSPDLPRFGLMGEPNAQYVIETSTDLIQWTTLFTRQASAEGKVTFSDPGSWGMDRRYYRARALPVR